MATVNAARVGDTKPRDVMPGVGDGQSVKAIPFRYDFSAAVPIGTVIQSPVIQAGSVVLDVMVVTSGVSTATFNVGYGGDPDYFAAAATGAVIRASAATAAPLVLTANDTIDIVTGTAVTGASGFIAGYILVIPLNT
ncbi:Uncharacterised protein [Achromobacter denitrificans]|uniref:hypothetical protein n=1 Tax=Achromobacter denitrificans TaxID=32002 RepID=UPI000A7B5178|nr:hypothetical protein [Achromobacter denitrificans]QKH45721.1 hypothetical protein FOC82_31210 [Achromobacter denitrificans]QKH52937.1 hypothetical protein FOC80_27260 [Achromobacter denitrificans]CAB3699241.1 hypothetical protein LMG1231_02501 [Achromobacter denitrificans]SUW33755.1 Uncharacterised protein [Achromobacter denitrificans]